MSTGNNYRIFDAADVQTFFVESSVVDGTFLTDPMSRGYELGYISLVFYSDAVMQTPVEPTAGSITFEGSENGDQWGEIDASMDATTFGPDSTYTRPTFGGQLRYVRMTLSGVTGANYFRLQVARYCRG